jgi:hypothetical protein
MAQKKKKRWLRAGRFFVALLIGCVRGVHTIGVCVSILSRVTVGLAHQRGGQLILCVTILVFV